MLKVTEIFFESNIFTLKNMFCLLPPTYLYRYTFLYVSLSNYFVLIPKTLSTLIPNLYQRSEHKYAWYLEQKKINDLQEIRN